MATLFILTVWGEFIRNWFIAKKERSCPLCKQDQRKLAPPASKDSVFQIAEQLAKLDPLSTSDVLDFVFPPHRRDKRNQKRSEAQR